jgi:type II secretory pathway pseudopilin PulG
MPTHAQTRPSTRRPHRRARRGSTLIEVVCASLILAIAITMIVGAITAVTSADLRARQQLEGLELANRLLLQFLDDKEKMPSQQTHINQGMGTYRFKLTETPVKLSYPDNSIFETPSNQTTASAIDQTKLISVTVWAGVPDGLGGYRAGEQMATLARIHNPLSLITRNPDTMARLAANPEQLLAYILRLVEQRQAEGGSGSGSGSGSSSRGGSASGGSSGSSSDSLSSSSGSSSSSSSNPFSGARKPGSSK